MLAALLPFLIFGAFALAPTLLSADDEAEDGAAPADPLDPAADLGTDVDIDGADGLPSAAPIDPATLGATFAATENGIDIQFGENETGRLAVVTYVEADDTSADLIETHEARYYLVPEGVEWPDNTLETASQIPGSDQESAEQGTDGAGDDAYQIDDFEEQFSLTLLGTYDLLAEGDDTPTNRNMANSLPALTTNTQATYYYLVAGGEADELAVFLQEGWLETRAEAAAAASDEAASSEGAADGLVASAPAIAQDSATDSTTDNAAAPLATPSDSVADPVGSATNDPTGATINSGVDAPVAAAAPQGAGSETAQSAATVSNDIVGGTGNDVIDLFGEGEVFGGAGDDILRSTGTSAAVLNGQEGDDTLSAIPNGDAPTQAQLFGGTGNDTFRVGNGATAFGDAGNDVFETDSGGTVVAGDGDDLIRVREPFGLDAGAATVSGGAGEDTFDIDIRSAIDAEDPVFTVITDFDGAEDVLVVKSNNTDLDVEKFELREDEDGAFTDVIVLFENLGNALGQASAIIRLMGVTGLTLDQILEL